MPIEIITGLPGHGKTLRMMERLQAESAAATRPLYVAGVDDLQDGLALRLKDPKQWNAIDPDAAGDCTCGDRAPHGHVIPDGSLIFIDEAWKWFGHLHDARQAPTPKHVLELAEHRHRGLDFIMTTQQTNQLYPFMRGLIGGHQHVARRFGLQLADVYTWGEMCEDVKSDSKREAAVKTTWLYPKALFTQYKSATQHTIKRKLPRKLYLALALIPLVLGASWLAYGRMKSLGKPPASITTEAGERGNAAPPAPTGEKQKDHVLTVPEYVEKKTPRLAGEPWSAPLYDGRAPTTDPQLLCMISGKGKGSSCHCYTEQATPYHAASLTDEQCRLFAVEGIYNPYRQPSMPQGAPMFSEASVGRTGPLVGPQAALSAQHGQSWLAERSPLLDQAVHTQPHP